MYPQGVCRIRKPACAGNGCAIFPTFEAARIGKKIRYPAADDLFRGSYGFREASVSLSGGFPLPRCTAGQEPSSATFPAQSRNIPLAAESEGTLFSQSAGQPPAL